jgi:AICAR transformylase/IMP cyclohydrolase PurH
MNGKNQGGISYEFRKELSQKVFQLMAEYNLAIAHYLKDISSNAHQYKLQQE